MPGLSRKGPHASRIGAHSRIFEPPTVKPPTLLHNARPKTIGFLLAIKAICRIMVGGGRETR